MITKEYLENMQKALSVAPKEVAELMDGNRDIYKFRKRNPNIYKYLLIGIAIEKSKINTSQLVKTIEVYKSYREDDE